MLPKSKCLLHFSSEFSSDSTKRLRTHTDTQNAPKRTENNNTRTRTKISVTGTHIWTMTMSETYSLGGIVHQGPSCDDPNSTSPPHTSPWRAYVEHNVTPSQAVKNDQSKSYLVPNGGEDAPFLSPNLEEFDHFFSRGLVLRSSSLHCIFPPKKKNRKYKT